MTGCLGETGIEDETPGYSLIQKTVPLEALLKTIRAALDKKNP